MLALAIVKRKDACASIVGYGTLPNMKKKRVMKTRKKWQAAVALARRKTALLSPERRSEIARGAARARWDKRKRKAA